MRNTIVMRTYTLITAFILLFSTLECYAQCRTFTFTTQAQVDSFSLNNPNCIEVQEITLIGSNIKNVRGLAQIKKFGSETSNNGYLRLENTAIENLDELSLEYFNGHISITKNPHLKILEFNSSTLLGNGISIQLSDNDSIQKLSFPNMDGAFLSLQAFENPLLEIIEIPGAKTLYFQLIGSPLFNNFIGFETVDSFLEFSMLNNGPIENFIGLGNVRSIKYFHLDQGENEKQLISSFEGFDKLQRIDIINVSGIESFKGLEALKSVGTFYMKHSSNIFPSKLKNLEGLQNLNLIESRLDITHHDSLEHLDDLNSDLVIENLLSIVGNKSLNICSNIAVCNHLDQEKPHIIQYNGFRCNNKEEILNTCLGFKKISIRFFYDKNENKTFDNNESLIRNLNLTIDNNNYFIIDQNDQDFAYVILDNSDHILGFIDQQIWELTTDSMTFFINGDLQYIDTIFNFGFSPRYFESNISSHSTISTPRCNTKVPLDLILKNDGTTTTEGYLWIQLSENIDTICFVENQPDTLINKSHFGFRYSNLFPGTSLKKTITIGIPGPPNLNIGDTLSIKSYSDFTDENGKSVSDTNTLFQIIQCSYDPNDKIVSPKEHKDNFTLTDETLNYTIRFQNTGNAEAYDVVVRDTLDPNLDISTFKLIGSSHEEILQTFIKDDQYITFEFKNIFLPDSTTDFEGSNGYVSYTIDHKEGIDENTKIENTAHIYFDFNPPIVTNTTENIMVSMFPTATNDLYPGLDINIYPNPTDGLLYLEGEDLEWNAMVEIVDLNGKVVLENQLGSSQQVNLAGLNQGVYFVHIIQRRGRFSGKVIVE